MQLVCCVAMLFVAMQAKAQQALTLKDVTQGTFWAERLDAVVPSEDGEHYTQISRDGQRIEQYSFKTGQLTGTLLDLSTARGAKPEGIDDYIMSPPRHWVSCIPLPDRRCSSTPNCPRIWPRS